MAKKGSINLSILSTFDSKGTDQGEKALQKFAKQYGEVDKASKQVKLDPVAEQLARQSIQADQTAAKLQGYSTKMTNVGKSLSLSVTAPIAAAGAAAFKLSTDFENSMNKVSTIADTSDVPMDTLRKSILQLSDDTGIAASDIADNVYNAISAGQKTGDAVAFVGNAAKLAKAGFTDSASALDVLTTTLNAYSLESDQAAHVSDVLLQTQNKGKTTVGELSASIGKAIPTAAAFNVNLENLAAAYATTTANGVATAESTTYIKSMLKELGDTGSTVGQIIQQKTGKSFADLMASGGTLGDALNALNEEGAKSNKTMYDMFGSAEAASAAAILASDNSSKFSENLAAMGDAAGLTDESFAKMESTTGSMNKAFNRIKNSALEFGDAIVADAQPILDGFTDTVKSVTEWFGSLDKGQRQTIVGVAAFAASLGPVTIAGGKVVGVASNVVKKYAELKAAQAAVTAGAMANGDALTRKTKILGTAGNALQKYATKANFAKLGAAGLAAVVAGVAIKAYMDAKEHQDKYTKATEGLVSAQSKAYESAKQTVSGMNLAGQSTETAAQKALLSSKSWREVATSVDSVIESQSQLADSLQKTFEDSAVTTGQLEVYASTIEELANKSNLSETEQSKLANAVNGLNEICGTSYKVTDSLNGKIADQNGKVLSNTEAIRKLVEAKKLEIQMDALSEAAKETYKAKEEAAKAYADAQDLVNQRQKEYDDAIARGESNLQTYQTNLDLANGKLSEAKGALDSATDACDGYNDQLNLMETATRKGSGSIHSFVSSHSEVAALMSKNKQSVSGFADVLEELGVSTADLGENSAEILMQLASDYDGTLDSLVSSCSKAGTKIPTELANKINAGKSRVNKAAGDMTSQASNTAVQNANGAPAGEKLTNTTASSIANTKNNVISSAGSMMSNAISAAFGNSDGSGVGANLSSTTAGGINTTAANGPAKSLVSNAIGAGKSAGNMYPVGYNLSDSARLGLSDGAWKLYQKMNGVATEVINVAKRVFQINSPSKVFMRIGEGLPEGGIVGVEKGTPGFVSAVTDMADDAIAASDQRISNYRPNVAISPASAGSLSQAAFTQGSALEIRVDRLDDTMKDVLVEIKRLCNGLGGIIRDNVPVVTMTEQQQARWVQKMGAMNV